MYTIIDDNSEEQQEKYDKALQKANEIKYNPVAFDSEFDAYADSVIRDEVPEKYNEWKNKGQINVIEAGKMLADEFDGTYENVLTNEMQRDNFYLQSKHYRDIEDKIQKKKKEKEERSKRVNEGSASFLDRAASFLDRIGDNSYQAQIEHAEQIDRAQRPNKDDKDKKYSIKGVDRAGRIKYNEIDLKKQIGFVEGLHRGTQDGKSLPFVAGYLENSYTKQIRSIKNKIQNGEQITEQELNIFNRHREKEYEKQVRGYTTGGIIGENWLPSMFAFGSEIALGGGVLKAVGLGGVGAKVGSAATNTIKGIKGSEKLAKGVGFTAEHLTQGALSGAVTTAVNPGRLFATYQERRLNDEMKITDKGTVIFTEAKETPAKAFIKSLGEVYLSYFSEGMGGLIGGGIKAVGSLGKKVIINEGTKEIANIGAKQFQEVLKHCPKLEEFIKKSAPLLSKAYEKINNLPVKGKSAEWLKSQVKFDGFLEELGEEVLEDVLNLTIGTNNEEKSLDNYRKTIFKTPEEWAVLAGIMALQGGSLSITGNLLGGIMQKNGNTPDEIIEVLSNSTETEKGELIEGLLENQSINLHDITTEEKLRKEEIRKDIYNKLVNANTNTQIAEDIAIMTGKFFENFGVKSEETRKKFDEFINNLKIKYDVPVEEIEEVKFQAAAMYKDKTSKNAFEFFNNVNNNFDNYKTAKYQFRNLKLSLPADIVRHDKKHNLEGEEWQELENNISNIFIANKINDKNSYGDNLYNFGIKTDKGNYYYVCIAINNKDNYIVTAAKNTKKGVEAYVTGKGKTPSKVPNAIPPVAPFSKVSSNNIITYIKEQLNPSGKTYFQSANIINKKVEENIKENFDLSVEELTDIVKTDIENVLEENNIEAEEFTIKKVKLYGSYSTGKNNKNSDLDFLVEYEGNMPEDSAFNLFAEAELKIEDKNGKEIKIDINPTKAEKSGTIDEHIEKSKDFEKVYYQEESNIQDNYMIAGYNLSEITDKLSELYEKVNEADIKGDRELSDKYMAKVHILEDAIEAVTEDRKFHSADLKNEIALNAYYVMNNQEIPKSYEESDKESLRSFEDYKEIHNKRKERLENEYLGYFRKEGDTKPIITIMANSNPSTALHEFGHLYLDLLNELSKVDNDIKKKLEAVNKWLGSDGEYTKAQHEKFARSFEAYLYKGKAPNNTLKGVFEHFKEWLKSVYESITDIADRGADVSPEVQELFDKMFSGDEYYEEKKQTNELLKKVRAISKKEKISNNIKREDNTLSEVEKRHKEAAYDILSIATGKSANYLKTIFETNRNSKGFDKKRENIQNLIEKVGDKITVSGGMKPEWKEFYTDTGVSYDNNEIGSDYELAQNAFDDIVNKNWRMSEADLDNILDERAISYERAINEADRQYKILIREFKKGNKNVALSAIYDWLEDLGGDLQKDYEERFIYDSALVERNENIDKFDKAKRQILSKALELENQYSINSNEKYKELVQETIKSLNFLQPSDKARLTANILDVGSTNMLMSSIDNILDIARTMEDVRLRLNLEKEIHKELQGTKNVKKNGRTVGKYNYKTNKIFEELRELDKLSPEKANELRLEMSKFATAEDTGLSYKDKLINKFLSYKAGGRTFADTELMKELYDEIVKIKLIGKTAKSELELQEKLTEEKDVEELINIVQGKKEANFTTKGYINLIGNLESTVNAIFNKDIKEKYASEILYAETQAQAWQHQIKQGFEQEVAKIYNLPQYMWDKKILDYLAEKHTYSERRRQYDKEGQIIKERSIDRTLTKMDIIQAYIWSKNEILEKRLINQFGEDVLDLMFDELSIEDVKLAELMMRTAQSFYPMVNKAFIQKYGLDLPKVSCYFPSTPERGSEVDLYNEYSSKSLNNGFTKSRAQSEVLPMDFHNPVATLYSHIEGVSKFAFMSDSLDRANLRFKNLDLKRAIINKFGDDAYRTLEQALMNVTYKKESTVFNGMNKIIDNMVGNWIQANIAIKPIVGLKQLLSANNYAVDMPYMTWQTGFLKALLNPKETIDYMMKIPYIKARFEGNFSNEFLKAQIENSAFATTKKLKDALTMFVKIGDIGAIIFGGKPYVDYLIKEKGMSEDEAIKQFILSTNRSQQSSAISSLSNFQVNMTRSSYGKLFIAFKNSPQQYIRMCGDAIISCTNGDISKTQCAKLLFQFGYLQPLLYAIATSGSLFRFIFAGDDDDLLKDLSVSIFNLGSDAVPLIGDAYKFAVNRLMYKEKYIPQSTPLLGDIENEISKISKEDVSLKDYLDAIGYLGLHIGLGYNSKAMSSMTSGVGDIFKGDIIQGSMKVLGYTDKRAKHISKEKE